MKRLPDHDPALVALLLATDPAGLGGVVLKGMPAPGRDQWLARFRALQPEFASWRKVPVNVSDDRLLGGLDFAATVGAGRPVFATGLLEASDGGVLVLSMAERLRPSAASVIADALERGRVIVERDGLRREREARFSVVALDEGLDDDETLAPGLADRLAFHLPVASLEGPDFANATASDVLAARRRLTSIRVRTELFERLCQSALAFGVASTRAELFMLRAARAAAALDNCDEVSDEHAAMAAKLILPQRATRMPAEAEPEPETPEPEDSEQEAPAPSQIPEDVLVEAVLASLPPGLLEELVKRVRVPRQGAAGGRGGPGAKSRRRGRPVGVESVERVDGARLNVLATLKAAAPWQGLRRRPGREGLLELRPSDLHVTRYKERVESTTIFVVDASGSQAAQRLAEVKGAIELLLNDCYVRRDQVALIAFRKDEAEILLQPTRALARVKRGLSALPGGGGTPLASGLDSARQLADSVSRQGRIPSIVLMTDGRANVARDRSTGAAQAEADAIASAKLLRASGLKSLLVDTSRRPRPRAKQLADAMGASYVPLPNADASRISGAVQRRLA